VNLRVMRVTLRVTLRFVLATLGLWQDIVGLNRYISLNFDKHKYRESEYYMLNIIKSGFSVV
jgi:hypothetical protein